MTTALPPRSINYGMAMSSSHLVDIPAGPQHLENRPPVMATFASPPPIPPKVNSDLKMTKSSYICQIMQHNLSFANCFFLALYN